MGRKQWGAQAAINDSLLEGVGPAAVDCDYRTETDYTPVAPELVARVVGQFRDTGRNAG